MRVVVAEDVMLTREGIARLLTDAGVEVAAEAGDAASLLGAVRVTQPDAAIVDIRMPPTHTDEGLVAAQQIRTEHPGVSVLILSQYVEPHYAMRLLEEHPERVGYLLKERVFDVANLIDALRRLADGETVVDPTIVARLFARKRRADPLDQLSGREREVLGLVAEGLSNRAIATRLFVTERTVEAHVKQIFLKLGLDADPGSHRRVLAVLAYLRSMPLPTVLLPGQAGAARARQVSSPVPRQRSGAERGRTPRSAREPARDVHDISMGLIRPGVADAAMQGLLDRAMTEIRQDMAAFAEAFPELAEVLRETIAGLPSLDPDSLHLLNSAASRLDLPEYAPMMDVAAARLDLPDYAPMVHHSARRLELPDYTSMLLDAAGKLELQIKFPCPKDRCHPSGNVVVLGGSELSADDEASGEQDHR